MLLDLLTRELFLELYISFNFFVFDIVFPLELKTRLYYLSITITTDILPSQMACSRIQKWILW